MNATDMDTEAAFRNDHETIAGEDPFAMFGEWLELAHRKEITTPMPWRWPPPIRTACPMCAWCC